MDGTRLGETLWTTHLEYMRVLDAIVERSAIRGENGVLLYLYHVNRPMYPGELTEKLGLTTGRIANILKELERERLILRTPDVLDKRRVRVALTPEGEVLARRRNTEAIAFHSRLLEHAGARRGRAVPGADASHRGADRRGARGRAVKQRVRKHLFKADIPSMKRF